MKYLSWIILFPLAVALVIFGVSNRMAVSVDMWPLPYMIDIPLYFLFFGTLLAGVLWGGVATWMNAGRARRKARQFERDLHFMKHENLRQKKEIESLKDDLKSEKERDSLAVQLGTGEHGDGLLKIESSAL